MRTLDSGRQINVRKGLILGAEEHQRPRQSSIRTEKVELTSNARQCGVAGLANGRVPTC